MYLLSQLEWRRLDLASFLALKVCHLKNTQMLYSSASTGTHYIIKEVNVVEITPL